MTVAVTYQNLYQSLCYRTRHTPNALALVYEQRRYSFSVFHQRVIQVMAQLSTVWKLNKGDRIILGWGNTPAFCELFYAAMGLGIVVVPFSTKLKQDEGRSLLDHIAPRAVFYDSDGQNWLAQCATARCVSLGEWQDIKLPETYPAAGKAPVYAQDTAVIMFTSGTTGLPKGAMITHGNLLCAVDAYANALHLTARDSTVLAVPIYHITGLSALLALFMHLGATIYLHKRFNADAVVTAIRQHNITFLHGSPTVFILLCQAIKNSALNNPDVPPESYPSLRSIACGAGHLNQGLIKELTEIFPHSDIHPVYGLTETSSPATIFRDDIRHSDKINSSGRAIPGVEIVIRDDRRHDLLVGQIGHIWLRGDVVIKQYWQGDANQNESFDQGWFYSGDLGYLDEDGYLFIKDRSKDMINRGGEKYILLSWKI
ncbi:class I adenylate-forming enzyme family protein [Sodalis ligni]|uniref:class I adenylate-forming enzyme family protein n=1 Tax=Sodalis ligni TaxID=2697027 RepID=UPI001A9EA3E9|nr:class I adenylate-forming enzyme family protein [Sodalis ligni]